MAGRPKTLGAVDSRVKRETDADEKGQRMVLRQRRCSVPRGAGKNENIF